MSTPLSTSDASSESHVWHELEDVFAALGQLARSAVAPQEFYRAVLQQSVRALSATGGVVWLRAAGGAMQPLVQLGWPSGELARDEDARRGHELLLINAAAEGRVVTAMPPSVGDDSVAGNVTEYVFMLGPVNVPTGETDGAVTDWSLERPVQTGSIQTSAHEVTATRAIIELLLPPDASPATYRGREQFLAAVCELAADYHAFGELRRLRENEDHRTRLLALAGDVHRQLDLSQTAYRVANEGRRVVGCDRFSVLVARGRRCRLLATSGVSRIERRSGAARRLEQLAELVRRADEPSSYDDGHSDGLPPVAEALEQHAEESHARQIAAVPLRPPAEAAQDELAPSKKRARARRQERPLFVLVAEQFDARDGKLDRERLVEVGQVCTTALYNALEFDRLPLGWLLRPLGAVKQQVAEHLSRTMLVLASVAAAVAALVFVPADFNIEAPGTLQPVVRRDVFAPRGSLVDEVLVAHGAEVAAGQPLVRLRDPSLELELKRTDGELDTAQRQLAAVRATRTNRAVREPNAADSYRLSAEERELEQRLTNLRRERELLNHERDQLVVLSPIAGRVLTWDVGHRLVARPVERGEVLLSVADLADEWQLELDVPDNRIGYVLAARQAIEPGLPVRFRLRSDDREQHLGRIAEVCQTADVVDQQSAAPSPTVLVRVALETFDLTDAARAELRPGVSARAQIACGRRPIGYVWLHDIWDTAIAWLRF